MAKKVLPTPDEFMEFEKEMRKMGYIPKSDRQFKEDFIRLDLQSKNPKEGKEAGFYHAEPNGLTVKVWTTWVREEGEARKFDEGWVLITEGDDAAYFARPLRRYAGFLEKLMKVAWINLWRVRNRPLCPKCGKYMLITRGPGLRSRYWRCDNPLRHARYEKYGWDHGLPPKALDFVLSERKKRQPYLDSLRKQGKPIAAAMLKRAKRKPWIIGKPENKIRVNV